jgi:hypothetical protein
VPRIASLLAASAILVVAALAVGSVALPGSPDTSRAQEPSTPTPTDTPTPTNSPAAAPTLASFIVSTTLDGSDELPGDGICATAEGECTLRAAIEESNALPGADTIVLPAGTYVPSLSPLSITGELTITGAEDANTIIDGAGQHKVLSTGVGSTVGISDIAVLNGYAPDGGAIDNRGALTLTRCALAQNSVGAIYNLGTLVLISSTLVGNTGSWAIDSREVGNSVTLTSSSVSGNMGGIRVASGTLTATDSDISNNSNLGGIFLDTGSTLIASGSTIGGNTRDGDGGGIYGYYSTMSLTSSAVSGNTASVTPSGYGGYGGGAFIGRSSSLTLTDSTVAENSAGRAGGGIYTYSFGSLAATNSTISGNTSSENGGGILSISSQAMTFANTTISGNTAIGKGGGIRNSGVMSLENVTVTNNGAADDSGISNDGTASLRNTIVADNSSGENCGGTTPVTSRGHNLDSGNSCQFTGLGDLINTYPLLRPLEDNGGPTFTHGLYAGSPAVDTGDNAGCLTTDQRGVARPLDGDEDGTAICDIGAYEFEPANPPVTRTPTATGTATPTPTDTATATPTPTATATPTPARDAMGVDANANTELVDTTAIHLADQEFDVGIDVTWGLANWQGWQATLQYNPSVLEWVPTFDSDGDTTKDCVTYTGLGGATLDSCPSGQSDRDGDTVYDSLFVGTGLPGDTTTATGQVAVMRFDCRGSGTSPLHLVTLVEDLDFGSTMLGQGGVIVPTDLADATITCLNLNPNADADGDGCANARELALGFNLLAWYDFCDVPVSANPDMTPNGPKDKAVTMSDVLAVLRYVGAFDGDDGALNPNGVAYDSVKGSCDWNGDTTPDKEGLCYDRSPSAEPNPPWDAGPPDAAVTMSDVLAALAQVGLSCRE